MATRPILRNSCAWAATAAEARFRIDAPVQTRPRSARVMALDDGAAAILRRVAVQPWQGARFFTCAPPAGTGSDDVRFADVVLRSTSGTESTLSDELAEADVAVMIATADDGAGAASAIGSACTVRGIMTAGLILGDGDGSGAAVSALRPYARVLLVTRDEDDVTELLLALRA